MRVADEGNRDTHHVTRAETHLPVDELERVVRALRGTREHPSPARAVTVGEARDRQAAALDLEDDLVLTAERGKRDRQMLAVEGTAHDPIDAQQRAGSGWVAQADRRVGERRNTGEGNRRLVLVTVREADAHHSVTDNMSFVLVHSRAAL
jgi:hypothetical protein